MFTSSEKAVLLAMAALVTPFFVAFMYISFVLVPVSAYTESKCLEAGYPRSRVTFDLHRYCMNMAGAVSVEVDKLDEVTP